MILFKHGLHHLRLACAHASRRSPQIAAILTRFVASEGRQDRWTGKGPVQEPGGGKRRPKWAPKDGNP